MGSGESSVVYLLTLALFVAWVLTNNHDDTMTTNDFTLIAHWLY